MTIEPTNEQTDASVITKLSPRERMAQTAAQHDAGRSDRAPFIVNGGEGQDPAGTDIATIAGDPPKPTADARSLHRFSPGTAIPAHAPGHEAIDTAFSGIETTGMRMLNGSGMLQSDMGLRLTQEQGALADMTRREVVLDGQYNAAKSGFATMRKDLERSIRMLEAATAAYGTGEE